MDRSPIVIRLRPMFRWFYILILLVCSSAQAAPGAAPTDDVDSFLHDKGLPTQLAECRDRF